MECATFADNASVLRIKTTYLWRHARLPDLRRPTRFTELVQMRKLYDRDPRLPVMADKVAIKPLVAETLGCEWVIPMLWSGDTLPEGLRFDEPVVLKSRHGCNQTIAIPGGRSVRASARQRTERWMAKPYGRWLDEWLYAHVPRGLLIEPFIGSGDELPVDYKIFVFHGQATHIQAHIDRSSRHRWVVHDLNWRPLSSDAPVIERPSALHAMIEAAEELAKGFTFVRVDFYQPGAQPLFGEMTFYPGSGLHPIDPPQLDFEWGRLWLGEETSRRDSHADAWRTLAA